MDDEELAEAEADRIAAQKRGSKARAHGEKILEKLEADALEDIRAVFGPNSEYEKDFLNRKGKKMPTKDIEEMDTEKQAPNRVPDERTTPNLVPQARDEAGIKSKNLRTLGQQIQREASSETVKLGKRGPSSELDTGRKTKATKAPQFSTGQAPERPETIRLGRTTQEPSQEREPIFADEGGFTFKTSGTATSQTREQATSTKSANTIDPAAAARAKAHANSPDVLVERPGSNNFSKMNNEPVEYVSKDQFEGMSIEPMDPNTILVKSRHDGRYKSLHGAYLETVPSDADGNIPDTEDARAQQKMANFRARMDELGLKDVELPATDRSNKTTSKERAFETPGGTRYKSANNYADGEGYDKGRDVLVKGDDGYKAYWAKDLGKDLGGVVNKYGSHNVYLKTGKNDYRTPDDYNNTHKKTEFAAAKLYSRYSGETLHFERKDMPKAFIEVNKGEFVAKSKYDTLAADPKNQLSVNPGKMRVLLQSNTGHALLQPNAHEGVVGQAEHKKTLEEQKLPALLQNKKGRQMPEVMVFDRENQRLLDGAKAKEYAGGKPLTEAYDPQDIYVQNRSAKGRLTGNYRDLPTQISRAKDDAAVSNILETTGKAPIDTTEKERTFNSPGLKERSRARDRDAMSL